MRVLDSSDSTSSWNSGLGVSFMVIPASAANVVPARSISPRRSVMPPGYPRARGSTRRGHRPGGNSVARRASPDVDDQLAGVVALVEPAVHVGDLLEREGLCHERARLAPLEQRGHLLEPSALPGQEDAVQRLIALEQVVEPAL